MLTYHHPSVNCKGLQCIVYSKVIVFEKNMNIRGNPKTSRPDIYKRVQCGIIYQFVVLCKEVELSWVLSSCSGVLMVLFSIYFLDVLLNAQMATREYIFNRVAAFCVRKWSLSAQQRADAHGMPCWNIFSYLCVYIIHIVVCICQHCTCTFSCMYAVFVIIEC